MTVATSRAESFKILQERIKLSDLRSDSEFRALLIESQALLELSDQELADAIRVSRPTVNRWIRGRNLPHNALRMPIFSWISNQLAERANLVRLLTQRGASSSAV